MAYFLFTIAKSIKFEVHGLADIDYGTDLEKLGEAMEAVAATHNGVICHELTVTENPRIVHAVLMVKAA